MAHDVAKANASLDLAGKTAAVSGASSHHFVHAF